jgi:peptide-methionine (S)-S-oxide reductase
MVIRYLTLSVALLFCLAVESGAQEKAAPDSAPTGPTSEKTTPSSENTAPSSETTAPSSEKTAPSSEKTTPSSETTESKTSAGEKRRSLGDKKIVSPSDSMQKPKTEQATFGAGCFWHVEAVFEHLKGVNWAVSGYAGGSIPYPSYEMVHEGTTGHAEVVMVDFDPEVISYEDLLKVFWKNHDPTSINRQGEDEGPQYRSVIFYHNEAQRLAALKSYHALTERRAYRSPIVTQLVPMRAFYEAEAYHQNYYGGKARASTRKRKTTVSHAKKSTVKTAKSGAKTKAPVAETTPVPETTEDSPKPLPKP